MASEDSAQFVSGFASIHRLGDAYDLEKTGRRQVPFVLHEIDTLRELLEVALLGRP